MTEWEMVDYQRRYKGDGKDFEGHMVAFVLRAEAEAKLAASEEHGRILEIALERCERALHGACDDKRVLIEKLAVAEAGWAHLHEQWDHDRKRIAELEAEIKRLDIIRGQYEDACRVMHYPRCWDTACYSSLADAIADVYTCEEHLVRDFERQDGGDSGG